MRWDSKPLPSCVGGRGAGSEGSAICSSFTVVTARARRGPPLSDVVRTQHRPAPPPHGCFAPVRSRTSVLRCLTRCRRRRMVDRRRRPMFGLWIGGLHEGDGCACLGRGDPSCRMRRKQLLRPAVSILLWSGGLSDHPAGGRSGGTMGTGHDLPGAGARARPGRPGTVDALCLVRGNLIDWRKQLRSREPEADQRPPLHGRPSQGALAFLHPVGPVWLVGLVGRPGRRGPLSHRQ